MSRIATIARRGFLVGSVGLAGGVAFGTWLVRKTPANPLDATSKPGQAVFNPWVTIDAKGITLIAPHTDVGQGVR